MRNLAAIRKMNGVPSVSEGLTWRVAAEHCSTLTWKSLMDVCVGEIKRCYAAHGVNFLPTFRDNFPRVKKSKKGRITSTKTVNLVYFRLKPQNTQGALWVADNSDVRDKLLLLLLLSLLLSSCFSSLSPCIFFF